MIYDVYTKFMIFLVEITLFRYYYTNADFHRFLKPNFVYKKPK